MIELYYWPTPNGKKITILLEELNVQYKIIPININKGEQFNHSFLEISPNNKIPAMTYEDQGKKNSLFESGSIMLFLAEKYKKFISENFDEKHETIQWLIWQMASFGPMLGQAHHFNFYAKDKIDYAIKRYSYEAFRLYNVLNKRLQDRSWIMEEYSIADMAVYPWTITNDRQGIKIEDFPNVKKWKDLMASRKAVNDGMLVGQELRIPNKKLNKDEHEILFGKSQYKQR